ncbi:MAG: alkaline phosphatase [Proteiniphilum sp.]|nr:alkaline phosphatase [Proteiniphilum sp.]MDD3908375.1 alkaline phosphatase [Proteiniphilum sp.]MDD4415786.1 alkaline phosphatase [Proteiniphilum sp.]
MKIKYLLLTLCFALSHIFVSAQESKSQIFINKQSYEVETIVAPQYGKVKNVILMIGDGMSLMHMYSAWTANRGKLWIDNAQAVGLSKTYCADRLITDSGAGGTAIACGQKTNYHMVGTDINGRPIPSMLDLANDKNKGTGVVVTCRLTDATPADFCCSNPDREQAYEIAADYLTSNVDFIFGGGAKYFENRPDGRDLFAEFRKKGYATPGNWEDLQKIASGKVFAVTDSLDLPVPKKRGNLLQRASMKAIETLSKNENGFVLMIEGSQIDDYGHFNDLDMLMQEVMDFDRTIGKIFEWAAKDGETLVIVTADHETGGLTLVDGDLTKGKIEGKFSTKGHSGVMVPVYAFGPGAMEFTGIYENADIFHKIKKLLKL